MSTFLRVETQQLSLLFPIKFSLFSPLVHVLIFNVGRLQTSSEKIHVCCISIAGFLCIEDWKINWRKEGWMDWKEGERKGSREGGGEVKGEEIGRKGEEERSKKGRNWNVERKKK